MFNSKNKKQKILEKDKELIENSKNYEDLKKSILGKVTKVIGNVKTHTKYHHSELGEGYTEILGQSSKLEISVSGMDPIQTVLFNSHAPIRKGDTLKVYLFKGREVTLSKHSKRKRFYVERNFKKEEPTKKIEIHYENGDFDTWEIV